MLFQAKGYELDLEVAPAPDRQVVRLTGQVETVERERGEAFVRLAASQCEEWVALGPGGEFDLDNLAPGSYSLEVHVADAIVEIPFLPL
jgi:hypothetical protein